MSKSLNFFFYLMIFFFFFCTLFQDSQRKKKRVEPRLRGGIFCSKEAWDKSPSSANLGNDHGFIIK